ncbi:MAG: DNA polymerase III subunit [Thermogutta sp.]|nr:DNA polymerase III subunit [Thermogutta sp.]
MAWLGIEGHDATVDFFRRAAAKGRLSGSYLFVGPAGIGKRTFALKLAQALLCQTRDESLMDPCGACSACVQVAAGTHPDVMLISRPDDRAFIPVELLIGERDNRLGSGFCRHLSLKPYSNRRRVGIIDDADYLNAEGANALLKTLEEPPPDAVLILIGTSPAKQLPTIRSRCRQVRFSPLPTETVAELLLSLGWASDAGEADRLARWSGGSLTQARELADPALWEFMERWQTALARRSLDLAAWGKEIRQFVDAAGKEAFPRRRRLQQLASLSAEFFLRLVRAQFQTPPDAAGDVSPPGGSQLNPPAAHSLSPAWQGGAEAAAACAELCLAVHAAVDRNANVATLIDAWAHKLRQAMRNEPVAPILPF